MKIKRILSYTVCFLLVMNMFAQISLAATTIANIDCSEDTYINAGSKTDNNYSTATDLIVKDAPDMDYTRKSLLKFDITDINDFNQIKLRLKGSNVQSSETVQVTCVGIDSNWDASFITWNNANYTEEGDIDTISVNGVEAYYEWDITSYVQGKLTQGATEISLLLEAEANSRQTVVFSSSEGNAMPQLVVIQQNNGANNLVEDAFVQDGQYANNNYGNEDTVIVKDGSAPGYTRQGYFKIYIGDKGHNDIERVFLKLYGGNNNDGDATINCYETLSNWSEQGINWNNKPQTDTYLDTIFVDAFKSYEIDITRAVINAIENGEDYVSITLKQSDDQGKVVLFNSSEATVNQPELVYKDGYTVVFEDNFTGNQMDLTKWEHRALGPRNSAINCEESVYVDGNGNLVIKTFSEDKGDGLKHYTGMINTLQEWTYGKFEARIQFNSSPATHSAFWLQSKTIGNPIGNPEQAGVEIDIVEQKANTANTTFMTLHWDGYGASHEKKGTTYNGADIGTGFHTFTLEWTTEVYKFFVDGELAWVTNDPISLVDEYIILSTAVIDKDWAGSIPQGGYGSFETSNTTMLVDYVRVSQEIN